MNIARNIECNICSKVTRVSIQVGYVPKHSVRVYCKNCNSLIKIDFNVEFDFEKGTNDDFIQMVNKSISVVNGELVESEPNYIQRSSSELLTDKVQDYNMEKFVELSMSPFIKSFSLGMDTPRFQYDFKQFLEMKKNITDLINIKELWVNGKQQLFSNAIKKINIGKNRVYIASNEAENISVINDVLRNILNSIDIGNVDDVRAFYDNIINNHRVDYDDLLTYLGSSNYLENIIHDIADCLFEFIDRFEKFIPVVGLDYISKNIDLSKYSITTCDVEEVKQFYIDVYESTAQASTVLTALNNVVERGGYEVFDGTIQNYHQFNSFITQTKGNIIRSINLNEGIYKLIAINIDKEIRNSFGHKDYSVNGVNQILKYREKKTVPYKNISILKFLRELYISVKNQVKIFELFSLIVNDMYLQKGVVVNSVIVNITKLGRNDVCYCGSGKKYKKCCLK